MISRSLKIKRDKKIEFCLLSGLWKSDRFIKKLKRNCRCYLEYYEERELELSFKDLNYVVSRVATIYKIIKDEETFETELNNIENCFSRSYVENKVKEFVNYKSDNENKNLVDGAVM